MKNKIPYALFFLIIVSAFLFLYRPNKIDFKNAACAQIETLTGEKINLELAKNPHEHAFGLMFREFLPDNRGMLFIFEDDENKNFWMKNTLISLDILFLDPNLRIRKIFKSVPPAKIDQADSSIPSVSHKAKYVLEIKSGTSDKYGLKEKERISIKTYDKESCASIISEIN
ncbi:MAG: DUF192 domain-containing protein [Elusimicrobiota bacterium]